MIPAPQSPATPTEATRTTTPEIPKCQLCGEPEQAARHHATSEDTRFAHHFLAPPSPPAQDGEAGELLATFAARMKTIRFLHKNLIGEGGLYPEAPLALLIDAIVQDSQPVCDALSAHTATLAEADDRLTLARQHLRVQHDANRGLRAKLAEAEARAAYWEAEMKRERRPVFVGRLPATSYGAPIPQAYLCTRCGRTFGGRFGTDERDETCPYCAITNELKRHHIMLPSQSAALASASPETEDHAND